MTGPAVLYMNRRIYELLGRMAAQLPPRWKRRAWQRRAQHAKRPRNQPRRRP